MNEFFTPKRREFTARSVMDVVKILVTAAILGGFFISVDFSFSTRISGVAVLGSLFWVSLALLPKGE